MGPQYLEPLLSADEFVDDSAPLPDVLPVRRCSTDPTSNTFRACVKFCGEENALPKGAIAKVACQLTHMVAPSPTEEVSKLGCTSNVIFLARANELATISSVNMTLSILSVMYVGINVVCIVLNTYSDCGETRDCIPATSDSVFHSLEFISTFVFNVVDLLALSYSPKKLSNQYPNPLVPKLIVLVNIMCSFTGCLLVVINLKEFETAAHELEYTNELTLAIFDLMILLSLMRAMQQKTETTDIKDTDMTSPALVVGMSLLIAVTQLCIYNLNGWTSDGDSKGETLAHYFEFVFGILSALVTFWFTMDNKLDAEKQMHVLMHAQHVDHHHV